MFPVQSMAANLSGLSKVVLPPHVKRPTPRPVLVRGWGVWYAGAVIVYSYTFTTNT